MSNPDSPWQNGFAESFFKTLKTNEVYLNDYQNIWEAKQNLFRFIDEIYNLERLHSSLGYLPPDEFEQKYWQEKSQQKRSSYTLKVNKGRGAVQSS